MPTILFVIALNTGFFLWIAASIIVLSKLDDMKVNFHLPTFYKTANFQVYVFAAICLAIGIFFGIRGYKASEQFNANLATEFISIAFAIFVIDWLNARRAGEQRKQEIFEQVQSRVRDVAVEALSLAIKKNWLNELIKQDKLKGGQFEGIELVEFDLQGANLSAINLTGAQLGVANLQEAYLIGAKLQNTKLLLANLQGANLWLADLRGAFLVGANLQEANLIRASLQGAKLDTANLEGAKLEGANLKGATYDDYTYFPDGFDPIAAGAVWVEAKSLNFSDDIQISNSGQIPPPYK